MRTLAPFALLSVSSFALVVAGCTSSDSSDPFGAEPDYASVQQRIASPTGTIGERNMSSLFSKYSEQSDMSAASNLGIGNVQERCDGIRAAADSGGARRAQTAVAWPRKSFRIFPLGKCQ